MTVAGTYQYLAPEIIGQKGYSTPVDVWMLGIILYEMVCGRTPFEPRKLRRGQDFIAPLIRNIKNDKPQFNSDFNTKSKQLIMRLLDKDPRKRIKISAIKKQELFKKYDLKKYDLFAESEVSSAMLNPKTDQDWYQSIMPNRTDLMMSMSRKLIPKKSIYKSGIYRYKGVQNKIKAKEASKDSTQNTNKK